MKKTPDNSSVSSTLAMVAGSALMLSSAASTFKNVFDMDVAFDQIPTTSLVGRAMGIDAAFDKGNKDGIGYRQNLLTDQATYVRDTEYAQHSHWHRVDSTREWVSVKIGNTMTSVLGIALGAWGLVSRRRRKEQIEK